MLLCRLCVQVIFILLSVLYVHQVNGAQPHAMGGWSMNSGNIQADCPTGFDCSPVVSGSNGFMQQRLIDQHNGEAFIQTIIGSSGGEGMPSSLSHANESIVSVSTSAHSGLGEGISFRQHINEFDPGSFVMDVNINSGWATPDGAANIDINNEFYDPGRQTGEEFNSVSHLTINSDRFGNRTGARIAISQNVSLGASKTTTLEKEEEASIVTTTLGQFDPTERDVFVLRLAEGDLAIDEPQQDIRLWIYHWKSTGLDAREANKGPLAGQWFYCESDRDAKSDKGGCASWSKHEAIPVPDTLPFDPLPFDAAMAYHSREEDEALYPELNKINDAEFSAVMTTPGPATGGEGVPLPSPQPSLPTSTIAAESTLPFGEWSVSAGEISVACPSGYRCEEISSGKGFIQVSLKDNASDATYYQVIVTERNAGGQPAALSFSSDALVRVAQSTAQNHSGSDDASGIAARLVINDSSNNMASSSVIQSGWANAGNGPAIDIKQGAPYTLFEYMANRDDKDNRTGFRMNIYQDAETLSLDKAANAQHLEDQQFVHREVAGDMLTSAGSVEFPGGRSLNWDAGDDVKVTMMRQNIKPGLEGGKDTKDGSGDTALDWNQGYGGPQIAFISYDNFSDNNNPLAIVSPDKPVTPLWEDSPFGSLPF